jgi:hypothetical protein
MEYEMRGGNWGGAGQWNNSTKLPETKQWAKRRADERNDQLLDDIKFVETHDPAAFLEILKRDAQRHQDTLDQIARFMAALNAPAEVSPKKKAVALDRPGSSAVSDTGVRVGAKSKTPLSKVSTQNSINSIISTETVSPAPSSPAGRGIK